MAHCSGLFCSYFCIIPTPSTVQIHALFAYVLPSFLPSFPNTFSKFIQILHHFIHHTSKQLRPYPPFHTLLFIFAHFLPSYIQNALLYHPSFSLLSNKYIHLEYFIIQYCQIFTQVTCIHYQPIQRSHLFAFTQNHAVSLPILTTQHSQHHCTLHQFHFLLML